VQSSIDGSKDGKHTDDALGDVRWPDMHAGLNRTVGYSMVMEDDILKAYITNVVEVDAHQLPPSPIPTQPPLYFHVFVVNERSLLLFLRIFFLLS